MAETKAQKAERAEAIETLRGILAPGDTVYTVLRHVSRSGMMRAIDAYRIEDGEPRCLSSLVARAGVGRWNDRYDAVEMGGCGMDMGFALVYDLSHTLYRDGFGCIGDKCPSSDHSNGDRDYTPHGSLAETRPDHPNFGGARHWHQSGGYALRHRWL